MANLTVVIDDDLLKAARIKALQEGTSVNELCRQAIERFAATADSPAQRARDMRALSALIRKELEASGFDPTKESLWPGREVLYEEAMAQRFPRLWAQSDADAASAAGSADATDAAQ